MHTIRSFVQYIRIMLLVIFASQFFTLNRAATMLMLQVDFLIVGAHGVTVRNPGCSQFISA